MPMAVSMTIGSMTMKIIASKIDIRTSRTGGPVAEDWCAFDYNTYDGCDTHPIMGWGPTEEAAVADLKRQLSGECK